MRMLTLSLCLLTTTAIPAMAQSSATSTAGAISGSQSAAGAVAIGGGNAAGGNARSQANGNVGNVVNIAGNPANTTQTVRNEGTITQKNVPTAFAPGLAAAGLETCLGSVSGGGSFVGTGFSFGSTVPDPGCAARLDARTLWSMGLKKAAVARLCLQDDIYRSMPDVCGHYVPVAPAGARGYPAPAPVGWFASATQKTPEPVLVVEGATGKERLCADYNEPGQVCRVWAYSSQPVAKPKKQTKLAAKPAPVAKPAAVAVPIPVAKPIETAEKKEVPALGF